MSWQSRELIPGDSTPERRDIIRPKARQEEIETVMELPASSKSRLPSAFAVMIAAPAESRNVMAEMSPKTGTTFCIAATACGPISCPIRILSTTPLIFMTAIVAMDAVRNFLRLLLIR